MEKIDVNAPVGKLVAEQLGRAGVFEAYGIDYCCGGRESLAHVCALRQIDLEGLLERLEDCDRERRGPVRVPLKEMPIPELVDHILDAHHVYLRKVLPRLLELAEKVEGVHGARHPELAELLKVYSDFKAELEWHMQKEEQVLFPLCKSLAGAQGGEGSHCRAHIQRPIHAMEYEHEVAGAALKKMRHLTRDYTTPPGACASYRALMEGLLEMELDLHQHIHKENNVLFPRALELALAETAGPP